MQVVGLFIFQKNIAKCWPFQVSGSVFSQDFTERVTEFHLDHAQQGGWVWCYIGKVTHHTQIQLQFGLPMISSQMDFTLSQPISPARATGETWPRCAQGPSGHGQNWLKLKFYYTNGPCQSLLLFFKILVCQLFFKVSLLARFYSYSPHILKIQLPSTIQS